MSSSAGPNIITNGLILHYDVADINSYPNSGINIYNLADSSTYSHIKLYGDYTNYASIENGVVNLSGLGDNSTSGSYLNGSGNLGQTVNSDFTTIGFMLRTGSNSAEIIDYRGTGRRLSFEVTNTTIQFNQREVIDGGDGYPTYITSASVTNELDTWNCYGVSRNGDSWSFYKDGELLTTNHFTMSEEITGGTDYSIGISWSDDDYISNGLNGSLGPLFHYTRALSSSEISQHFNSLKFRFNIPYQSPSNIITDGLILHLDATDTNSYPGSGTTWYDLSGNGADASAVNLPTYTTGDGEPYFQFNGTDHEFHSVDISQEYRDLIIVLQPDNNVYNMTFGHHDNHDDSLRIPYGTLRTATISDQNDWHYGSESDVFVNGQFDATGVSMLSDWSILRTYRSNDSGFGTSFRYEISSNFLSARHYGGKIRMILAYDRKLKGREVSYMYNILKQRFNTQ